MQLINLLLVFSISVFFTACIPKDEYANEGTRENPVQLILDVVHHGSTGSTSSDSVNSFYEFTTTNEGRYTFAVSSEYNLVNNYSMGVNAVDRSQYYGGADDGKALSVQLDANTTYTLLVVGHGIVYFDLLITSPTANNTSSVSPAVLTLEQNLSTFIYPNSHGYYTFDVSESDNYSIEANSLSVKANLDFELYADGFNNIYVESANSDSENNETMSVNIEAGRYNLAIRNYADEYIVFKLFIGKQ